MQLVSQEWKQAHQKTILNESFVEVSLHVADPDAVNNVSSKDNGAIYFSDSTQLVKEGDKTSSPYCTLEQNMWCLDGKRKAIPTDTIGYQGYVSDELSNDTCVFATKFPTITLSFTKAFTTAIPGVTITWSNAYGEFADTFEVIAYKDNTIVASKEVTQNRSITSKVLVDIINYNRIEIIVKKWCLPNHRARIEEVKLGCYLVYGKSELLDYSHTHTVDPLSTSLPKNEIRFSVNNIDGAFNPQNPNGLTKYLAERIEVKVRYGMKINGAIEWIKGGTFFLAEWDAKQNGISADFTARDILEFLSNKYRYATERDTNIFLTGLTQEVLNKARLPKQYRDAQANYAPEKWDFTSLMGDKTIYEGAGLKNLVIEDTSSNLLQLVANAITGVMYVDRDGVFHITALPTEVYNDYVISASNSYTKPELSLSKPIAQVRAKAYTYSYDKPDPYIETEEYAYPDDTVAKDAEGEVIVVDNPLVGKLYGDGKETNWAGVLAEWMYKNLRYRTEVDASWRGDVRLDPLDIILLKTDYGIKKVRVFETEFKFNGAFRCTCKGKVIDDV